jgi:hypothetical protein
MASLEAQMLEAIRAGIDQHNRDCPMPAKAILLNPGNYELFDWQELWGIPVMPDERVKPERFRIDCDGSAFGIEDAVEEFAPARAPSQPLKVS